MKISFLFKVGLIVFLLVSCSKSEQSYEQSEIPMGFDKINYPTGNEFSVDRFNLGKKLFYDPILSIDSSKSCNSCHRQEFAFADNLDKSPGVFDRAGKRNAPTLTNVAYLPYVLFEGGVPNLEMQILVPIQEHNEFNSNIVAISKKLNLNEDYVNWSLKAYNRKPDPFVITRAISNFQRELISGNSAFDQFEFQDKKNALSEKERKGYDLFFSNRTNCNKCHSGFQLTNYAFENNGLYENYEDPGRYHLTGDSLDLNKFKIPTLRNVGVSGPYMHDGSIQTLKAVIEHYNKGGKNHISKSHLIKPLHLTEVEKENLLAFLLSLTDYEFLENPRFKNEE